MTERITQCKGSMDYETERKGKKELTRSNGPNYWSSTFLTILKVVRRMVKWKEQGILHHRDLSLGIVFCQLHDFVQPANLFPDVYER